MTIEIMSVDERPINASELMKLYREAGWWEERSKQDIQKVIDQGDSVGAWSKGVLIGFARAVSDGEFRAYIEDVVIHKEFQKSGTGTKLVSTLLDELSHIDVISLFCEKELIPFYEKNGFKFSETQYIMHRRKGT
ncbi:GNAT family N-acetyltransferase [Rossellomorea sp. NS-SX7]|uniref:GNAT family N-acetyltransferase n=1 Tax=Rossellomorea sp. NS-SX7 TaxID=3463856 RepID=UPI00405A3560